MGSHDKKMITIATALLGFALAAPAFADQRTDSGLYISGGIGRSEIDRDVSLRDDTGTTFRVAAGWQITPMLGIEASLYKFDKVDDNTVTLSEYEIDGLSLAGTLRLPLSSRLAVFGKLGQVLWKTDLADTFCSRGPAGCITTFYDIDEADTYLALGLGWELIDSLELELAYEYFDFNFGSEVSSIFDHETAVMSASLKLEF